MEYNMTYSIVVPLFNEELVIKESYKRIKQVLEVTKEKYEIIFVNDGSKDGTRVLVEEICKDDDTVVLVNFSRNFGHQAAITAGMEISKGEAVVVIDADLQDPPEIMLEMMEKWNEGYEVVYAKRAKRLGESYFKKATASAFYRLLRSITSVDIPVDTGDFRLIDRKVCKALMALPEKNRYVRGLVSWVGYKQTYVEFERQERFAGETKYPLKKMIKFAVDGITAFSYKPLTVATTLGSVVFIFGLIVFFWQLFSAELAHTAVVNIGMLMSTNLIMFGMIFMMMGIMGQYIGRIFDESKNRPMYIIDDVVQKGRTGGNYENSSSR